MILANVDWLSISINLLLILFVVTCLLLCLVVLMQRPKQEGLGAAFGSGMTDQMFGARTTNVLQKGTVYLATLFFVLTLTLAILYSRRNANQPTMVQEPAAQEEVAETEAPAEETAPSLEESLPVEVTEIPAAEESAPAAEEAPAATDEAPAAEEVPAASEEETPAAEEEAPAADEGQ